MPATTPSCDSCPTTCSKSLTFRVVNTAIKILSDRFISPHTHAVMTATAQRTTQGPGRSKNHIINITQYVFICIYINTYILRHVTSYTIMLAVCQLTNGLLNFGALGYVRKTKYLFPFLTLALTLSPTAYKIDNRQQQRQLNKLLIRVTSERQQRLTASFKWEIQSNPIKLLLADQFICDCVTVS